MSRKTALIIRHVPREGVAGFRDPIEAAGYAIDRIDVTDSGFAKTDLSEPDLLVMMGGPMGVYEQRRFPWIACQLKRLARRLERDRPTLGVCFGAQMIAAALGGRVYPGPIKEVGFAPLVLKADPGPLRHLQGTPVLHWHGDTFTLPPEARLLASTRAYPNQAFSIGRNILALQFHAEMGMDSRFEDWVDQWPEALAEAGTNAGALRREHQRFGHKAVAAGRAMIGEWLDLLVDAPLLATYPGLAGPKAVARA